MSDSLWGTESHIEDRKSITKHMGKFVLGALILLILLGGGFFAYYIFRQPTGPNVSVEVVPISDALLGEPFSLTISYANYSDNVLKDAVLSLALPDGVSLLGRGNNQRVSELVVGDVGPGSVSQQTFNVIAFEGAQTIKRFQGKLKYKIAGGSSTVFEAKADSDVPVGQSAISLGLSLPQSVVSGESMEVVVTYENISKTEFKNLTLSFTHPQSFRIDRTSRDDIQKNNISIPSLSSRASGTITLFGTFLGAETSELSLGAKLATSLMGQSYDIASQTALVAIAPSPFKTTIEVNGSPAYIARIGDRLEYIIRYRNNAPVQLQYITARATFSGELFVPQTVNTSGVFNSLANTITWDAISSPELTTLAPGEERTLTFSVNIANQFPIRRLSDKNFALKVRIAVESPTVPPGLAASKTVSIANIETKVQGRADLRAAGYFYDASSGILNNGPYPPRANQKTQYTIHWTIVNYATDVQNARVSAFLEPGVQFTETVKSSIDAKPIYNPTTGEITWDIPLIMATKGIVGSPLEATFQIEATPSVAQVGQNIPLIRESRFSGTDAFTGVTLESSSRGIDSSIQDDTKISGTRSVQP